MGGWVKGGGGGVSDPFAAEDRALGARGDNSLSLHTHTLSSPFTVVVDTNRT